MRRVRSNWASSSIGSSVTGRSGRRARTPAPCLDRLVRLHHRAASRAFLRGAAAPRRRPSRHRSGRAVERRLVEAARRAPGSFDAHHGSQSSTCRRGEFDAAIPHLERACAIDPTHYVNGHDLALAYLETGRLDEARQQVGGCSRPKETAELYNLLGDVDERAGNSSRPPTTISAPRTWPDRGAPLRLGQQPAAAPRVRRAGEVFTAGIDRHPGSARLHVGLGIARYSRGQYEDAVRAFCAAADLAPVDPRPYQFLGEMYGVSPALGGEITRRLARFVERRPPTRTGTSTTR